MEDYYNTEEYLYTKEEAAQMRSRIIEEYIKPRIKACFDRYTQLKSVMLLVAQYWADEADDAVHYRRIFSVLETPDLEAALKAGEKEEIDSVNLPGFKSDFEYSTELYKTWWSVDKQVQGEEIDIFWEDNGIAIPAFAAFCQEDCHQDMSTAEAYTPYAIFRRNGEEIDIEIVGQMYRPWLDGIKPEEWEE